MTPPDAKEVQAGEGWRLLNRNEIPADGDEFWSEMHGGCWSPGYYVGDKYQSQWFATYYRRRIQPPPPTAEPGSLAERIRALPCASDVALDGPSEWVVYRAAHREATRAAADLAAADTELTRARAALAEAEAVNTRMRAALEAVRHRWNKFEDRNYFQMAGDMMELANDALVEEEPEQPGAATTEGR